jgi:hypothetical protein
VTLFVPILVDPEYVSQLIVITPLVAFGTFVINEDGTVHAVEVATPVAIVPDVPAKLYRSVCVKLFESLGVDIVIADPNATLDALTVGVVARGIVVKT